MPDPLLREFPDSTCFDGGDRDVVAYSADGLPAEYGRRRRPPAGPALRV
jgi:hypothetical protein